MTAHLLPQCKSTSSHPIFLFLLFLCITVGPRGPSEDQSFIVLCRQQVKNIVLALWSLQSKLRQDATRWCNDQKEWGIKDEDDIRGWRGAQAHLYRVPTRAQEQTAKSCDQKCCTGASLVCFLPVPSFSVHKVKMLKTEIKGKVSDLLRVCMSLLFEFAKVTTARKLRQLNHLQSFFPGAACVGQFISAVCPPTELVCSSY